MTEAEGQGDLNKGRIWPEGQTLDMPAMKESIDMKERISLEDSLKFHYFIHI